MVKPPRSRNHDIPSFFSNLLVATMDYRPFVSLEILDSVRAIRGKRKEEILRYFYDLGQNPFMLGDFQLSVADRELQVKVFGKYSVYFWVDHAVREVKIVELLKSDE